MELVFFLSFFKSQSIGRASSVREQTFNDEVLEVLLVLAARAPGDVSIVLGRTRGVGALVVDERGVTLGKSRRRLGQLSHSLSLLIRLDSVLGLRLRIGALTVLLLATPIVRI